MNENRHSRLPLLAHAQRGVTMTTSKSESHSRHFGRANANHVILSERDASDASRLLKLLSTSRQDPIFSRTRGIGPERQFGPLGATKRSPASTTSAKQVLTARRVRGQFLDDSLFSEPGWDMLLALYITDVSESRNSISRLTDFCGAAPSTALRWICILEKLKLIRRVSHPTDLRTVFIELTIDARRRLDDYFSRIDAMGLSAEQH